MPNITLEYTNNVTAEGSLHDFLQTVHQDVVEITGADLAACKSKIIRCDEFVIADGSAGHGFVYLTVRLLSGRSETVRKALGERLLARLQPFFAGANSGVTLQLSALIEELDRDFYFKLTQA